jgi:hypothetical protein
MKNAGMRCSASDGSICLRCCTSFVNPDGLLPRRRPGPGREGRRDAGMRPITSLPRLGPGLRRGGRRRVGDPPQEPVRTRAGCIDVRQRDGMWRCLLPRRRPGPSRESRCDAGMRLVTGLPRLGPGLRRGGRRRDVDPPPESVWKRAGCVDVRQRGGMWRCLLPRRRPGPSREGRRDAGMRLVTSLPQPGPGLRRGGGRLPGR